METQITAPERKYDANEVKIFLENAHSGMDYYDRVKKDRHPRSSVGIFYLKEARRLLETIPPEIRINSFKNSLDFLADIVRLEDIK